ncbi:kelch domain-containing protein 9-like [Saccostrea echinata]|uniref:kelch domain-containing protein 9-like n=1 Tax=Saccostrea echinata TaxID=191078 RepID=UPI002A83E1EF|nr:kelch domain-containing protein 9-like [Saccostrea echinata]
MFTEKIRMAKAAQQKTEILIDWEKTAITGPVLGFHAGCVVGNNFYIHGGVESMDSKTPSNRLYQLSSSEGAWTELSFPGSPSLSHHAAVDINDRYIILIGGWNGKSRSSKIYAFDTEKQQWTEPTVTGFPEDGGLSSHTATVLNSGKILILGREGSLRMQRRHGSMYLLSGSVESGRFIYREYTQATASRSGHTANVIGNVLCIVGGRDSNLIEIHTGFKSLKSPAPVTNQITRIVDKLPSVSKTPAGRKNHVSVVSPGAILIHGGETFDGRNREPVGEMLIFATKPCNTFYKVGVSEVKRAGHVCGVVGDEIILHGGFGGKKQLYGDTFFLKFKK